MVDAEIPLLIGGTSLEKRGAILDLGRMKISLPGKAKHLCIPLNKEPSGHYSFFPKPPTSGLKGTQGVMQDETILIVDEICSDTWSAGETNVALKAVLSEQLSTSSSRAKKV